MELRGHSIYFCAVMVAKAAFGQEMHIASLHFYS